MINEWMGTVGAVVRHQPPEAVDWPGSGMAEAWPASGAAHAEARGLVRLAPGDGDGAEPGPARRGGWGAAGARRAVY